MKVLLEKGAAIESKDNDGRSPLSWTTRSGGEAAVKVLENQVFTTHRTGTSMRYFSCARILTETVRVLSTGVQQC